METSLIQTIQRRYRSLRASEQKVADIVLSNRIDITTMTIEEVAQQAGVSQPTVIRFARALELDGFKDLKRLLLAERIQRERTMRPVVMPIASTDKMEELPAKLIATNIEHLQVTLENLSINTFIRAVSAITAAKSVAIFGVENSASVACDLYTKLAYLGINAIYYADPYLQNICAKNLSQHDVAIAISYSGTSRATVDSLRIAKGMGVTTVAITNFDRVLLNKFADHILCAGMQQYMVGSAIFSRCAELALIDMLYNGILLSDYEKYSNIIERNGQEVRSMGYDFDASPFWHK